MRRMIVIIALLAVVGIGAFLFMFKREAVMDLVSSGRGYPKAKTAQECVDNFKKAIADRKYDMAARYCTKEYAEQLTRGNEAAQGIGSAIDDLKHRMKNDGVMTEELEAILLLHDPLPPEIKLTVQSPGEKEATALIGVDAPDIGKAKSTWQVDMRFIKAFYSDYPRNDVKLVKESDGWKLDFTVTPSMRERVDHLNRRHKDYVNAFKKMSEELRIERTTKAEVSKRLLELLNDANTAAK